MPKPCRSCEPAKTERPSATAPAKMIAAALTIAASTTNAIARVTKPMYSGRGSIAVQQSPQRVFDPVVSASGPLPHDPGELVGQAQALPTDGGRDGRAAGDLVDQPPEVVALQQARNELIHQLAVYRPGRELLGGRAFQNPLGDAVG